jgi:hypothetical protein
MGERHTVTAHTPLRSRNLALELECGPVGPGGALIIRWLRRGQDFKRLDDARPRGFEASSVYEYSPHCRAFI